ncbi:MAG: hypothetical protein M3Q27_10745 [Actinomycetota bacterium]|nr:hypothetical protein [Actinomycetota bacterium]
MTEGVVTVVVRVPAAGPRERIGSAQLDAPGRGPVRADSAAALLSEDSGVAIVVSPSVGSSAEADTAARAATLDLLGRLAPSTRTAVVTTDPEPHLVGALGEGPEVVQGRVADAGQASTATQRASVQLATRALRPVTGARSVVLVTTDPPPGTDVGPPLLAQAQTTLSVVYIGEDPGPWKKVARRSGGALITVSAREAGFAGQRVVNSLQDRFVLTFRTGGTVVPRGAEMVFADGDDAVPLSQRQPAARTAAPDESDARPGGAASPDESDARPGGAASPAGPVAGERDGLGPVAVLVMVLGALSLLLAAAALYLRSRAAAARNDKDASSGLPVEALFTGPSGGTPRAAPTSARSGPEQDHPGRAPEGPEPRPHPDPRPSQQNGVSVIDLRAGPVPAVVRSSGASAPAKARTPAAPGPTTASPGFAVPAGPTGRSKPTTPEQSPTARNNPPVAAPSPTARKQPPAAAAGPSATRSATPDSSGPTVAKGGPQDAQVRPEAPSGSAPRGFDPDAVLRRLEGAISRARASSPEALPGAVAEIVEAWPASTVSAVAARHHVQTETAAVTSDVRAGRASPAEAVARLSAIAGHVDVVCRLLSAAPPAAGPALREAVRAATWHATEPDDEKSGLIRSISAVLIRAWERTGTPTKNDLTSALAELGSPATRRSLNVGDTAPLHRSLRKAALALRAESNACLAAAHTAGMAVVHELQATMPSAPVNPIENARDAPPRA